MRRPAARAHLALLVAVTPLLAGGDCKKEAGVDGGGPGNAGFITPTAATKANQQTAGVWTEIGPADWSCLNTPSADQASSQALSLTGLVDDFQTGNPVGAATVTAFPDAMLNANSGMATSSDVAATRGQYAMTLTMLPAGSWDPLESTCRHASLSIL